MILVCVQNKKRKIIIIMRIWVVVFGVVSLLENNGKNLCVIELSKVWCVMPVVTGEKYENFLANGNKRTTSALMSSFNRGISNTFL